MSKFTRGPWNMVVSDKRGLYSEIAATDVDDRGRSIRCVVAYTAWTPKAWGNALSNAHLITAAPDMYEALISIENDDGRIPAEIWEMRQAALKKAKGESRASEHGTK